MPKYGDGPRYWDARYSEAATTYDWLQDYSNIKDALHRFLGSNACKILHVGCGNSKLPEQLYDDGFKNIVNVDNSSVVISQMKSRNATNRPELQWVVGDATALCFQDASFDVALDKSVLDTFACGDDAAGVCAKYLGEVKRLLKNSGVYLSINFGGPETRMCYLRAPETNFDVETITLAKTFGDTTDAHYLYVCRRGACAALASPRLPGIVECFDRQRGFGFVQLNSDEQRQRLFVHWRQIRSLDPWPSLQEGMDIECAHGTDERGREIARDVTFLCGVPVMCSQGGELEEKSSCTMTGTVVSFSRGGEGRIKLDAAIDSPDPIAAGSEISVSREHLLTNEASQASLRPGQRVQFKVSKSTSVQQPVTAIDVCQVGGKPLERLSRPHRPQGDWSYGSCSWNGQRRWNNGWHCVGVQRSICKKH